MHGQRETSQGPRLIWTLINAAFVGLAAWFLFGGGVAILGGWFGADWQAGDPGRRGLLIAFGLVFLVRGVLTAFVLLQRRFDWAELGGVVMASGIYQLLFPALGATSQAPLGVSDGLAVALFVIGSFLNTGSELQRKRFKADPANKGRLYTGGLFSLARHINYFGDVLWCAGWALATHNAWAAIVPVVLFFGFNFGFIPPLHRYLEGHYGAEYVEWVKHSKKIVPFIY